MQTKVNVPTRKAVGIWIRVSTEDQAKGDSPELHEKRRLRRENPGFASFAPSRDISDGKHA
jgi:hypothetical protein